VARGEALSSNPGTVRKKKKDEHTKKKQRVTTKKPEMVERRLLVADSELQSAGRPQEEMSTMQRQPNNLTWPSQNSCEKNEAQVTRLQGTPRPQSPPRQPILEYTPNIRGPGDRRTSLSQGRFSTGLGAVQHTSLPAVSRPGRLGVLAGSRPGTSTRRHRETPLTEACKPGD
jgi:hypothetical protein